MQTARSLTYAFVAARIAVIVAAAVSAIAEAISFIDAAANFRLCREMECDQQDG